MNNLSDDELITELLKRLQLKDKAIYDLRIVTRKLEGMNAKLMDSEKTRGHFLSNIKNEINNPLTSVLTACELFLSADKPHCIPDCRKIVSTIHKEALSLSFQMRNIFAAAELEAGETTPSPAKTDIPAIIKNAIEPFKNRVDEKNITINLSIHEGLLENPLFGTDSEKLELAVANLVSNAIEFSYEGAGIEITANREKHKLEISVQDHGVGIDEKDHRIIFERFKQLDTGTTKSHAGHGLGLSILKAVVDVLNGTITVKSRKGEGAIFTISLPETTNLLSSTIAVEANEFFFSNGADNAERF